MLSFKDLEKEMEIKSKNKVYCKCGHSIELNSKCEKLICSWCGRTVYSSPKNEFRYKLMKEIKKAG